MQREIHRATTRCRHAVHLQAEPSSTRQSKKDSTRMQTDARRCTRMGLSPACSFTAEVAQPYPRSRAVAVAPVPSACIRVHLSASALSLSCLLLRAPHPAASVPGRYAPARTMHREKAPATPASVRAASPGDGQYPMQREKAPVTPAPLRAALPEDGQYPMQRERQASREFAGCTQCQAVSRVGDGQQAALAIVTTRSGTKKNTPCDVRRGSGRTGARAPSARRCPNGCPNERTACNVTRLGRDGGDTPCQAVRCRLPRLLWMPAAWLTGFSQKRRSPPSRRNNPMQSGTIARAAASRMSVQSSFGRPQRSARSTVTPHARRCHLVAVVSHPAGPSTPPSGARQRCFPLWRQNPMHRETAAPPVPPSCYPAVKSPRSGDTPTDPRPTQSPA